MTERFRTPKESKSSAAVVGLLAFNSTALEVAAYAAYVNNIKIGAVIMGITGLGAGIGSAVEYRHRKQERKLEKQAKEFGKSLPDRLPETL